MEYLATWQKLTIKAKTAPRSKKYKFMLHREYKPVLVPIDESPEDKWMSMERAEQEQDDDDDDDGEDPRDFVVYDISSDYEEEEEEYFDEEDTYSNEGVYYD